MQKAAEGMRFTPGRRLAFGTCSLVAICCWSSLLVRCQQSHNLLQQPGIITLFLFPRFGETGPELD